MQDMMRGVVTGGTAGSIMGNKELSKRMICGKTGTVNDFTDAWFIGYTPSYTAGVWIGYPGLKKTLGNKEAGSVAALPMWISFMEKFLADKPNDKFPKAPGPDKEIIAKRAQAESAIRKAEAAEAESAAKSTDDTADKAKSAAQDDGATAEPSAPKPPPRPAPRMDDNGETPRPTSRPPRDVERNPSPRPPASQPEQQTPKKRGKNG
jgi:penicillin-binding protein 1A